MSRNDHNFRFYPLNPFLQFWFTKKRFRNSTECHRGFTAPRCLVETTKVKKEKIKITFSNSPTVRGTFPLLIKSKDMKDCHFSLLICFATSFFFFSIAMATKENVTFQRGMLKSIQSKVNTLASILYVAHVQCCMRGTK